MRAAYGYLQNKTSPFAGGTKYRFLVAHIILLCALIFFLTSQAFAGNSLGKRRRSQQQQKGRRGSGGINKNIIDAPGPAWQETLVELIQKSHPQGPEETTGGGPAPRDAEKLIPLQTPVSGSCQHKITSKMAQFRGQREVLHSLAAGGLARKKQNSDCDDGGGNKPAIIPEPLNCFNPWDLPWKSFFESWTGSVGADVFLTSPRHGGKAPDSSNSGYICCNRSPAWRQR
jgi:hypothetical protein